MQIAVIVNPTAGGDPHERVEVLRAELAAHKIAIHATAGRGDGEKIAFDLARSAHRPDVVVAVGGDGTVGEVVAGLHRAAKHAPQEGPALVVAPGGTGNSNYRGLWNDLPWEDVARMIGDRSAVRERLIDLVHVGGLERPALLGSATGVLPAALTAARNLPLRGRDRLLSATLAALSAFQPFQVQVTLDGRPFADADALVTNVGGFRHRGGLLQILPRSVVDDGRLDVCVVNSSVDIEQLAKEAIAGDITTIPGVSYGQGKRVSIRRVDGSPITFEHDGELYTASSSSYEIHVLPAALKVLVALKSPDWFS